MSGSAFDLGYSLRKRSPMPNTFSKSSELRAVTKALSRAFSPSSEPACVLAYLRSPSSAAWSPEPLALRVALSSSRDSAPFTISAISARSGAASRSSAARRLPTSASPSKSSRARLQSSARCAATDVSSTAVSFGLPT